MPAIDLPRPLEDYFAHAELDPGRSGRRFCITLTYFESNRLGKVQWWWRLDSTKEQLMGHNAVLEMRARAVERFVRHVEQWLNNTGQTLSGDEPIPRLAAVPGVQLSLQPEQEQGAAEDDGQYGRVLQWPGNRAAAG